MAAQAWDVLAQHIPRLPDLYQRVTDRDYALRAAQDRADRPVIGHAYRAALTDGRDDHDRAATTLAQACRLVEDARGRADHHDRQATDLIHQIADTWAQAHGPR